ncbi:MAG: Ig-like domain-containing protein [Planctomycetota bacterium]|nr:Ig-like domain-containing protein [Planctomycetota bacterium]
MRSCWIAVPVLALSLLLGCRGRTDEDRSFLRVIRMMPELGSGRSVGDLLLNQEITAYFSHQLDTVTVTRDTFKVIDSRGRSIPGRLDIGTRSITFIPEPPLKRDLSDGSYHPGRSYRVVVPGGLDPNSVRSKEGSYLREVFQREFRARSIDSADSQYPSPLWPVGTDRPFEIRPSMLRMADESASLRLHFSRPVLPSSVKLDSVELRRLRAVGGEGVERVRPVSVRVLSSPPPIDSFPGCTVELTFDLSVVNDEDLFYLFLARGANSIRDYGLETVKELPTLPRIPVYSGKQERLLDVGSPADHTESDHFEFAAPVPGFVGFECSKSGAAVPRATKAAGTGVLGSFVAARDMTLTPGELFDRGDGRRVSSNAGTFDFVDVEIPVGITVTLRQRPGDRVRVRAAGRAYIGGVLQLEFSESGQAQTSGATVDLGALEAESRVMLIAAGDIWVDGSIRAGRSMTPGQSPLTLLSGGNIQIDANASLPDGIILATAPGRNVVTRKTSFARNFVAMPLGLALGGSARAEAWTRWYSPARHVDTVRARALDVTGRVDTYVQVAQPHPGDRSKPYTAVDALAAPVKLPANGIQVPAGGFVRFLLRAELQGGEPLPSVGRLVVEGEWRNW